MCRTGALCQKPEYKVMHSEYEHTLNDHKKMQIETKQVDLFEADANMRKVGLYKEL